MSFVKNTVRANLVLVRVKYIQFSLNSILEISIFDNSDRLTPVSRSRFIKKSNLSVNAISTIYDQNENEEMEKELLGLFEKNKNKYVKWFFKSLSYLFFGIIILFLFVVTYAIIRVPIDSWINYNSWFAKSVSIIVSFLFFFMDILLAVYFCKVIIDIKNEQDRMVVVKYFGAIVALMSLGIYIFRFIAQC